MFRCGNLSALKPSGTSNQHLDMVAVLHLDIKVWVSTIASNQYSTMDVYHLGNKYSGVVTFLHLHLGLPTAIYYYSKCTVTFSN